VRLRVPALCARVLFKPHPDTSGMYCLAYGSARFGLVLAVVLIVFLFFLTLLSLNVRISIMTFGNNQPRGSRELRWRIFVVDCMVFVTFGVSASLGANVALPIEGNTLGFVFKTFRLENDKRCSFVQLSFLPYFV
jgi:hypothetical protein